MRRTLTLCPVVRTPEGPRWLAATLPESWVDDERKALRVELYARPTAAEQVRIDLAAAEIMGSAARWTSARDHLLVLRGMVLVELESKLWPNGDGPESGTEAWGAAINEAWTRHKSEAADMYASSERNVDLTAMLASWEVCCKAQPPGWERPGDIELSREATDALVAAFRAAVAEYDSGNVPATA